MTENNTQYHNYNHGKVGYNEFNNSATNFSGITVSLDSLLNETEEAANDEEGKNPSETWLMTGINK